MADVPFLQSRLVGWGRAPRSRRPEKEKMVKLGDSSLQQSDSFP